MRLIENKAYSVLIVSRVHAGYQIEVIMITLHYFFKSSDNQLREFSHLLIRSEANNMLQDRFRLPETQSQQDKRFENNRLTAFPEFSAVGTRIAYIYAGP